MKNTKLLVPLGLGIVAFLLLRSPIKRTEAKGDTIEVTADRPLTSQEIVNLIESTLSEINIVKVDSPGATQVISIPDAKKIIQETGEDPKKVVDSVTTVTAKVPEPSVADYPIFVEVPEPSVLPSDTDQLLADIEASISTPWEPATPMITTTWEDTLLWDVEPSVATAPAPAPSAWDETAEMIWGGFY